MKEKEKVQTVSFSDNIFIFRFLAIFLIIYIICPKKYRNLCILSGSLLFYWMNDSKYLWLLIISLAFNYLGLILVHKEKSKKALIVTIVFDVAMLFVFKYWNFGVTNINIMLHHNLLPVLQLALPLGISFYTFQNISILIDCYKEENGKKISFLEYATFITMFPHILSGPIFSYPDMRQELKCRNISMASMNQGFRMFVMGLGMKVLLSNKIETLWNSIQMAGTIGIWAPIAWLGAIAYSFQIYFDFAGYSLMAIGIGKMLGFHFPENFRHPYCASSISDFWRRWHITLGKWFTKYIYIPLGGNRKGKLRTVFNIFVVWSLTGIWHGASWNFVLWGLLFGICIGLEKIVIGKLFETYKPLGHIWVIVLLPISWMLFANTNLQSLLQYIGCMFGKAGATLYLGPDKFIFYLKQYWILLFICILFSTPLPQKCFKKIENKPISTLVILCIFFYSVYQLMQSGSNPFLYLQF